MDVDGDNRIHVNVPSWYIDVPFIYHADEMNAMELLQHLLLYSPIQRMKGADALKHSFLCGLNIYCVGCDFIECKKNKMMRGYNETGEKT